METKEFTIPDVIFLQYYDDIELKRKIREMKKED